MLKPKHRILFLTMYGIGNLPKMPGTYGSAAALILGIPILYFSAATLFLCAVLIGVIAIREIDIFEREGGKHDAKMIVIDELVGMWITMSLMGFNVYAIICSFVLFRAFDIKKPSIIGRVDEDVSGGLGVVGDDALAGFFAGITGLVLLGLLNLFFGIDVGFLK